MGGCAGPGCGVGSVKVGELRWWVDLQLSAPGLAMPLVAVLRIADANVRCGPPIVRGSTLEAREHFQVIQRPDNLEPGASRTGPRSHFQNDSTVSAGVVFPHSFDVLRRAKVPVGNRHIRVSSKSVRKGGDLQLEAQVRPHRLL